MSSPWDPLANALKIINIQSMTAPGISADVWAEETAQAIFQNTSGSISLEGFQAASPHPTSLLIPFYIYPTGGAGVEPRYVNLIKLARKYKNVAIYVILNPSNGPGTATDGNYLDAVRKLHGAGIKVLGYVSTDYIGSPAPHGNRTIAQIEADVSNWAAFYPSVDGIFFDEMTYSYPLDPTIASSYITIKNFAHSLNFAPVVSNPGVAVPDDYYTQQLSDVIVVAENNAWPTENDLSLWTYNTDYSYLDRAVLVWGSGTWNPESFLMARKYVGMLFCNDAAVSLSNAWNDIGPSLEQQLALLDTEAEYHSAGAYNAPTITDNGDGTLTLGSGDYVFYSDANATLPLIRKTITGQVFTPTNQATSYIVANFNNGSPILQILSDTSTINETTVLPIVTVFRYGTSLDILDWDELGKGLINKITRRLIRTQRFVIEPGGFSLGELSPRAVTITGGTVWYGATETPLSSYSSLANILYLYAHSSGAWVRSTIVQYNNSQYDDGSNVVALGSNRYAVNWVFRSIASDAPPDEAFIVLGSGNYTLAQAQASTLPANLPPQLMSNAMLVGRIIVQNGAASAYEIDSVFSLAFELTATTDHNALANLQGGTPGFYYHLTDVEYTGTGTGSFVRQLNPTFSNTVTLGGISAGSVLFAGAGGLVSQDNTNFAWNNTSKLLTVSKLSTTNAVVNGVDVGNIWTITKDPTGFDFPENVVLSYDPVSRTVTLTGTFQGYYRGYAVPGLTTGWVSPAHAASPTAPLFLFYNGSSYVWTTTPWTFDSLMIAYVIYDSSSNFKYANRETHGLMPWQAHQEAHQTIGTYSVGGGTLYGYALSSTAVTDRRPSVYACSVKDEDNITTNAALTTNSYTQLSLSGTGLVGYATAQTDIVSLVGSRPNWNQLSAGTWVQTPMANNSYMSVWLIAVPAAADSASQQYRFMWVQGQSNGSLAQEQTVTFNQLSLGNLTNFTLEFVAIGRVILQYTGGNWSLTQVDVLAGTRISQTIVGGSSSSGLTSVSTNSTLSGIGTPASPLGVVNTPYAVTFDNGGAGGTSGSTFNGGAALTVSYNTVGAQPLDADLTAIAALSGNSGFLKTNGAGTWSVDTAAYLPLTGGTITGTLKVQAAVGQDAILLQGRAGGTGNYSATLLPGTLSGNINLVLPATAGTLALTSQTITTFTTTGSSGAATYSSGTLNIPNYTLAGLGGLSLSGGTLTGGITLANVNNSLLFSYSGASYGINITNTGFAAIFITNNSTSPSSYGGIIYNTSAGYGLVVQNNSLATNYALYINNTANTIGMGVLNGGTSIGAHFTSSNSSSGPSAKFSVTGVVLPYITGAPSTGLEQGYTYWDGSNLKIYNGTSFISIGAGSGSYLPLSGGTLSGNLTISTLTSGSILFAGTGGLISQNNGQLFWDNTNNRLGIGTTSPGYTLDVNGTGHFANTNVSTSTTTGSLVVAGGVGIGGATYIGGNLTVSGTGTNTLLGMLSIGGGLSGQFSNALVVNPTTYAGSARASLSLGGWQIGQDSTGTNVKNFYIYDGNTSANRLAIDTSGNTTLSGNLTVSGTGNSSFSGNVGIGTSIPVYKLDVSGQERILTTYDGYTPALFVENTLTNWNAGYGTGVEFYSGTDLRFFGSIKSLLTFTGNGGYTDLAFGTRYAEAYKEALRLESNGTALFNYATNAIMTEPRYASFFNNGDTGTNNHFVEVYNNSYNAAYTLDQARKGFSITGNNVTWTISTQRNAGEWESKLRFGFLNTPENYSSGFSDKFVIQSDGRIGINNTTPSAVVDVYYNASTVNMFKAVNAANSGGSNNTVFIHSDQPYSIATTPWSGSVLRVTAYPNAVANNTGNILFVGTGNSAQGDVSPYLVVKSYDGKVGIGTTSPAYKLDVSGDIRATGTIYGNLNGNAATATTATTANAVSFNGGLTTTSSPTFANLTLNGDTVVSSGSNSNGYYVKYYDGTMIQWFKSAVTVNAWNTITLPISFIDTTYSQTVSLANGSLGYCVTTNSTKTSGSFQVYQTSNGTGDVNWMAIGRWK